MEIAFEYLLAAIETTRGTAITTPAKILPIAGTLIGRQSATRPEESTGLLAQHTRSGVIRRWGEWEGEGNLDLNILPFLLNALVRGNVTTPATPGGATDARLWTFTPTMTADDIETLTMWFGDPNVQIWRAPFGLLQELTITNDASSEDGATMSLSGITNYPLQIAAPTAPAYDRAPIISGINGQVWLDTSSPIGTTELTDARVVSVEHVIPLNGVPKYTMSGPGASKTYGRIGRGKRSITTRITLEIPDTTEYDLYENESIVKCRVRHNGPLIEPTFYYYLEVDTYGLLELDDFGDLEGTNRTMTLSIISEYDATLGADWSIKVQNEETGL